MMRFGVKDDHAAYFTDTGCCVCIRPDTFRSCVETILLNPNL
jgi:hypothetical protein